MVYQGTGVWGAGTFSGFASGRIDFTAVDDYYHSPFGVIQGMRATVVYAPTGSAALSARFSTTQRMSDVFSLAPGSHLVTWLYEPVADDPPYSIRLDHFYGSLYGDLIEVRDIELLVGGADPRWTAYRGAEETHTV